MRRREFNSAAQLMLRRTRAGAKPLATGFQSLRLLRKPRLSLGLLVAGVGHGRERGATPGELVIVLVAGEGPVVGGRVPVERREREATISEIALEEDPRSGTGRVLDTLSDHGVPVAVDRAVD